MGQKRLREDQNDGSTTTSATKRSVTEWAQQELTASDLQSLLCFAQDAGPGIRNDLEKVRSFLKTIKYAHSEAKSAKSLRVFLQYLQPLVPSVINENTFALPDIIKTWNFSSQFDDTRLFTTCTALLADILEILGSDINLRGQGVAVCQTILINDHFSLVRKGMTASKARGYPIIACLRLTTQLVSFDGGVFSRTAYRKGLELYSRLEDLLTIRNSKNDQKLTQRFRSIRHHAIALLMATLRVQDGDTKKSIFSDGRVVRAIFQFIGADEAFDIVDILQTLKRSYYSDEKVSRSSKGRSLPESTLAKILALYDYPDTESDPRSNSVADTAHEFLLYICCTLDCGALVSQMGWYSSEFIGHDNIGTLETRLGSTNSQNIWQKYTSSIPVKNTKLAQLLQDLKPYRSPKHQALALNIFRTAPELVADYFLRRKSFTLQPKLTATWVGYVGFVFAVARLDPPELTRSGPLPNPFVVIESIIPSCISREIFIKCLTSSHALIKLLAAKLMIACLRKLQNILSRLGHHEKQQRSRWSDVLTQEFQSRCPEMQSWSLALKSCPAGHVQLKEAFLQVIAQYHELLPSTLLGARFEIPGLIADSLVAIDQGSGSQLEILNLDHLSKTALLSPMDSDWFRRPERLTFSPFMTVLRLYTVTKNDVLGKLSEYLLNESFALRTDLGASDLKGLAGSIQPLIESQALFAFLNNCFTRLVQKSLKYEGDVEAAGFDPRMSGAGLLIFVVLEQLSHFLRKSGPNDLQAVQIWIHLWTKHLLLEHGAKPIFQHFIKSVTELIQNERGSVSPMDLTHLNPFDRIPATEQEVSKALPDSGLQEDLEKRKNNVRTAMNLRTCLSEQASDFPQLSRWSRKDVADAVEDGDVAALMSCLCAHDSNVRQQAKRQLQNLSARVLNSAYTEKQQLYLLLMELDETVSQHGHEGIVPTSAIAFAQTAAVILHNPAHRLYIKINNFLTRAPVWKTSRLLSYWRDKILAKPSQEVDDHVAEVKWFVQLLIDGLQTHTDLDIYRRQNIFEGVLLRYDGFSSDIKATIIELLWRCSHIKGGSTTLITRCGLVTWCKSRKSDIEVQALGERILATCDMERIQRWSFDAL